MSEKQQRLVLSIIDFLNQSISDGTVREEDKESLEVAGTSNLFASSLPSYSPISFLSQCNVSEKLSVSIQKRKSKWIV
jgi:hypothetical protein